MRKARQSRRMLGLRHWCLQRFRRIIDRMRNLVGSVIAVIGVAIVLGILLSPVLLPILGYLDIIPDVVGFVIYCVVVGVPTLSVGVYNLIHPPDRSLEDLLEDLHHGW